MSGYKLNQILFKMKNLTISGSLSLILIFALSVSMTACGGKDKKKTADKKLGKLEIEIPEELKDNPEAIEYIEGMVEVADEYALLVDDLFSEVGEYAGMEEEDLGIKDKLKLTSATAKYAINATEVLAKWGEYETKRLEMYEEMTEEDVEAMKVVYEHIEKRFGQIEEKYQKFE